jgi:hypothetical protein
VISHLKKHLIFLDYMLSDMTNKIREGVQDGYIISINLLVMILPRKLKLRMC